MSRKRKDAKVAGSAVESASETTLETPAKKSTRRQLRGKAGGLKDMPHMPLDILI